jgi:hypothetical protein
MEDNAPLAETPAEDLTTKIEMPGAEAPVETKQEPEAKTEDVQPETGEETPDEGKKNIPGSQRLKRRLQLIEQEHSQALQELETLRRERQQPQQQNQGKPGIDREPTEADFPNDYFAYERAKTAWEVRQSVRDEIRGQVQQERNSRAEQQRAEIQRERLIAYEENKETARERIPDFDKVVSSATDIVLKNEVIEELLASDKSALLQYHLAKNPDKARELNGMSGRELAREIGRLESRVHLPTPKKATEATPPPTEIKGGAAPQPDPQFGPDDMNAYAAWRRKQAS